MSKRIDATGSQFPPEVRGGMEALQSTPEIRGPAEPLDGYENKNHFGLIYETQEEQFATVVPYVRQGLERGEQCVYIAAENSREDVLAALRGGGVDVDGALERGQLVVHGVEETYLEDGEFAAGETLELLETAMEDALDEYEGFRVTAEETWLVGDETHQEAFMAVEACVNDLLEGEDAMALCQYNRAELPPSVIEDVIETHPYLVYDGTACQNVYYTPPEEYFGPENPARDNERKLETLIDRTDARTTLRDRDHYQRRLHEIMSRTDTPFEEKLDTLFELGCERFGMDFGAMAQVNTETNRFEVDYVSPDHEHFEPGLELELSETYCTAATDGDGPASVSNPDREGYGDITVRREFGIQSYLGTHLRLASGLDRTFFFVSDDPRDEPITDEERTFLNLMGQWIKYELEHRQRERFLRECYEITATPDLDFEAKIEQLLDLGRDWMGLDAAGLSHLPECDGKFLTEYAIGFGGDGDGVIDASDDAWTNPGEGCFCRQVIREDEPVGMADVRGTDWENDRIHREHGLTSYLGTKVTNGSTPYGTLWVGSTEPRDREFTATEKTFLDLIGQWVSYELERREHNDAQRELYEITADNELSTDEKFEQLLELGCEYLDLPVGMMTRERGDAFEIEQMHGSHPDLDEGTCTPPMTDNYCRQVVDTGEPISVADAERAGWDGDALYEEFGLESYAGLELTVGDDAYGTICFTDLSPREASFTEAEQTFLDLMGQCASYELERNHREDELQQTNDRLESFASMLAHELRNPVTIGQIYGQQLPEETDTEAVEYVTEAFDRIEDMIDVMLVLTRGREAVGERTPVSLGSVARDVWDDMDAPDAALDVTLDQTIQADETYVRHLFRNLFDNAVEHGGGDVSITVGESSGGFYVADDGRGIPEDDREKVFEAGYTTTADTGGTGLGLAFVQKLAEVYEWGYGVTESEAGGARLEFHVQ